MQEVSSQNWKTDLNHSLFLLCWLLARRYQPLQELKGMKCKVSDHEECSLHCRGGKHWDVLRYSRDSECSETVPAIKRMKIKCQSSVITKYKNSSGQDLYKRWKIICCSHISGCNDAMPANNVQ